MAAFSAGGWHLGGALEIRLRVFRVGVGNLHDPALGNIMNNQNEDNTKHAQRHITARMYIGAPAGRLGLRGAAARRSATWPFALVGLRATSHTCDSLYCNCAYMDLVKDRFWCSSNCSASVGALFSTCYFIRSQSLHDPDQVCCARGCMSLKMLQALLRE